MIDQPTRELKLVEYNTIASSFGCLSQKVRNLHHYLADKYAPELKFNYNLPIQECCKHTAQIADLYLDSYIDRLVNQFCEAINLYRKSTKRTEPVCVLFVIEDNERNVIDQKLIESTLYSCCKVQSLRCTFEEIYRYGVLDQESGVLKVHNREIGFVYYRTGYQLD